MVSTAPCTYRSEAHISRASCCAVRLRSGFVGSRTGALAEDARLPRMCGLALKRAMSKRGILIPWYSNRNGCITLRPPVVKKPLLYQTDVIPACTVHPPTRSGFAQLTSAYKPQMGSRLARVLLYRRLAGCQLDRVSPCMQARE